MVTIIGGIGIVGSLVVIYGIYIAVFKNYEGMFKFLLITSIFTTTAVVNIGENSITIPHMIALLFTLKVFIGVLLKKIKLFKVPVTIITFTLYSFLSIFFVGSFTGGVVLVGYDGYSKFGGSIIIQFIYLLMAVLIFYGVYILIINEKINIKMFDSALIISMRVLVSLSIFQFINRNIFNIIFVNKIGQIFVQTLENGQFRLTATFNEPSMLATFLGLSLIYFTITAFNEKKNWRYVVECIIIGLLSRGSTFILALIIWGVIIVIVLIRNKNIKKVCISLVTIICSLVFINIKFENAIYNEFINLINKFNGVGTSGSQRISQFVECIKIFKEYPITGIGFGANRGSDWISTLLCNCGVIGTSLIVAFFGKCVIIKRSQSIYIKAIKLSVILCIVILFISVPEPYYNYFWIFIAFSLAGNKNIVNSKIYRDMNL